MSFETVQAYFERFGMADRCMDLKESSATVALAALALGTEAVSYTHLTLPTT